jgi:DNA-binding NtrC family response regulator
VPVRVIAATNRNLRLEVDAGAFREDFFYRLAAYEIVLPPLRDRRSDIPLLVEHFRRHHQEKLGLPNLQPPSDEVLALLKAHSWPGNVRELEHVVQRAIVDSGSLADARSVQSLLSAPGDAEKLVDAAPAIGDDLTIDELEKLHIEAVLARCGGNRTRAAEVLGIERKSLYRKAKRLGIALDSGEVEL